MLLFLYKYFDVVYKLRLVGLNIYFYHVFS